MNNFLNESLFSAKVPYPSHASRVYDYVIREILERRLSSGSRLLEAEVAQKMGMSTAPVRDAFQKLYQDGWIKRIHHKGAYVTDLKSREVLEELSLTRVIIESGAASLAAERITELQLAELRAALGAFAKITKGTPFYESLPAEINFHRLIVSCTGCDKILEVFDSTILQFLCIKDYYFHNLGILHSLQEPHSILVQVLEDRDPERAAELTRQHILQDIQSLFSRLEDVT